MGESANQGVSAARPEPGAGFFHESGALDHRRYAIVEAILAFAATAAAAAWWSHDRTGGYFFAFAALALATMAYKTMQIDMTVRDAPNRVDRGQTLLARLSGRRFKRFSWARKPLLILFTEHCVYVFESTIRPREPVVRRAYNDLLEFGLGEKRQAAALRVGLPDQTVVISGLITSEVAAAEEIVDAKRPRLIKQPIWPVLDAMLDD